jgi:hypothetical protein
VNELALGTAARDTISESVGCNGRVAEAGTSGSAEAAAPACTALEATTAAAKAATVASAATTKSTAETATTALESTRTTLEAATSTLEATLEAATTSAESTATASVAILTNFEKTTLPVIAVHDVDGILCILRSVKSDDTRSLGRSVRSLVDISANDVTRLAEKILQILPADREWKL